MTQRDLAGMLKVTPMTLRNWKKDKPKLYEIIQKGLAFDELLKKAEQNVCDLKALENSILEKIKDEDRKKHKKRV